MNQRGRFRIAFCAIYTKENFAFNTYGHQTNTYMLRLTGIKILKKKHLNDNKNRYKTIRISLKVLTAIGSDKTLLDKTCT